MSHKSLDQDATPPKRVVFFSVRNGPAKLAKIAETAQSHFEKGEPFLIFVEDDPSLRYVDELLWKFPATSFLPHSIHEEPATARIAITKVKKNLNGAKAVFNLCPTPLLLDDSIRLIYEFEDLTTPSKQTFSTLRFEI